VRAPVRTEFLQAGCIEGLLDVTRQLIEALGLLRQLAPRFGHIQKARAVPGIRRVLRHLRARRPIISVVNLFVLNA
jgi:hypothetical protein